MQTVNESRLEELAKNFPWFGAWFSETQKAWKTKAIRSVGVQRTDLTLCQRAPGHRESIAIFDKDGVNLGWVGFYEKKSLIMWILESLLDLTVNFTPAPRFSHDYMETVEAAILRIEAGGKVPYYVVTYDSFRTDELKQLGGKAILHKPKGESLPEWLKEIRSGQGKKISDELEKVG